MKTVTNVWEVEAHVCVCPECKTLQFIENSDFKYFLEHRITANKKNCSKCKTSLFIIKPEG